MVQKFIDDEKLNNEILLYKKQIYIILSQIRTKSNSSIIMCPFSDLNNVILTIHLKSNYV